VKKKLTRGPPATVAEGGFIVVLFSCIFLVFVQVTTIAPAQVLPFRQRQELIAGCQRRRRRRRQSLLPQLAEEGKGRRRRGKEEGEEERKKQTKREGVRHTRSCNV
jgi:hypothetical protein